MDPKQYDQFLISEYLRYGSINRVFEIHHYNLAVSYASFARLLAKHQIIKSAGPNSHLSESLDFLNQLPDYRLTLKKHWQRVTPKPLHLSIHTLHRIVHQIRLGITRRHGTALLISPSNNTNLILVGNDSTLKSPHLGHKNDLSLPMTHSRANETPRDSIMRVLQREVFSLQTIDASFPHGSITINSNPRFYVNIADIKVAVYQLFIDPRYVQFTSFKLNHIRYMPISVILDSNDVRPGVKDIINHYLDQDKTTCPIFESQLNQNVLAWSLRMVK